MTKHTRPTYLLESKLDIAQQAVDFVRPIRGVTESLELGKSTDDKWARQLRNERNGQLSSATPLTPDQLKIRELERKIKDLGIDNIILKNSLHSTLSPSD